MARRGRFIGIGILVVLVIIGGWWIFASKSGGADEAANGAPAAQQAQAPAVSVLKIEPQTIQETRTLPGRISAFRQSQIRPQVDGIITERLFEEGATVEKGQQLYQIDDARYKAALNSAEADLKSAQANIKSVQSLTERYKKLIAIKAVSQQEYDDALAARDQAQAAIAVAQAAVDVAKVNLGYTKVFAPISGDIGRSLVTEGSLVTANQSEPLSVITQLDPVYVDMQQSGAETAALRAASKGKESVPVEILIGENGQIAYPHKGELKFSEVTVDEGTGSIALRAVMPNGDGTLMPGMFVRAVLHLGEKQAILVPQRSAVRGPDGGLSVWVVEAENIANPRPIKVSSAYQDNWIVTEGLSEGETIIIEGYQKIAKGAKVTPTSEEKAKDSKQAEGQPR